MPRQSAPGADPGRPERDDAPRPCVTSAFTLTASRRTAAPCITWTRARGRGNAVDDDRPPQCPRTHTPPETANRKIDAAARTRRPPEQEAAIGAAAASSCLTVVDNVAVHLALDRRSSDALSDPLLPPRSPLLLAVDDDNPWPFDHRLIQRPSSPVPMEPVNTKFYQLGNGGSLIFEHDLNALSDHLGRPHPEFHGSQIANQPGGELQWIITADLRGKMEPPTSERILFSFMESNWLDGLARGLQEGLARLCGMSGEALKHPRFSRGVTREPMDMPSHPELKHHVEHLDFMLYHTQQDLDHSREYANQTHARIIEQGDAIKMLANDRRTLRQQRAKRDATITRLRAKIAALEATVKAQEEQMKKMEEDGEDIQGGSNYLSDDNDFEEDENTEGEDYDFLDDEDDDHTPIDVDEDAE
ncbi:hypothetical protein QYE76_005140 [Lolium multiflorum]|uniref:Uncharacterized protein n=1 Tax=Lolium multiflorum TaxID=4521 RepID=A0AAD8W0F7_LOLMU|nr:hypothetical protein QYE76_005140 [Lolium multiflorum]